MRVCLILAIGGALTFHKANTAQPVQMTLESLIRQTDNPPQYVCVSEFLPATEKYAYSGKELPMGGFMDNIEAVIEIKAKPKSSSSPLPPRQILIMLRDASPWDMEQTLRSPNITGTLGPFKGRSETRFAIIEHLPGVDLGKAEVIYVGAKPAGYKWGLIAMGVGVLLLLVALVLRIVFRKQRRVGGGELSQALQPMETTTNPAGPMNLPPGSGGR